MQVSRSFWSKWARSLQQWQLKEPVAVLLEAAGPLTLFLAQFFYIGQPFISRALPAGQWEALAQMLENREEVNSFTAYLREETIS